MRIPTLRVDRYLVIDTGILIIIVDRYLVQFSGSFNLYNQDTEVLFRERVVNTSKKLSTLKHKEYLAIPQEFLGILPTLRIKLDL